jgi:hypothetical protein
MTGMPHPIPQHLHRQITRHGNVVWYVRIGKGPRTRIRAEFGTVEFFEQYRLALAAVPKPSRNEAAAGSLAWLIARYRETTAWNALSPATRRQRENIFKHVIESAGTVKASTITTAHIVEGRAAMSSARRATRLASPARHTACGRSQQRERRTVVRPSQSLKHCSAGQAGQWLRSTRGLLIEIGLRAELSTSWQANGERTEVPHLSVSASLTYRKTQ